MRPVLRRDPSVFIEIRRLSRDLHLHTFGIESRDAPYSAFPPPRRLPVSLAADTVRRNGSDPRHHGSAFHLVRYAVCMDAAEGRNAGKSVWDILFGLQLGVTGGIIMLAWFALVCPLVGKPWWLIPNLFGSHFYNSREVYLGPGIVTIVGAALQIVMSGLVGCLSGLATPADGFPVLARRSRGISSASCFSGNESRH